MGVKGLWRLLLPIGRRVSIEVLEGKVLAIDASIWLTQFLKAMRDPDSGKVRPAAHLIGFFRRLAKLRFHGIRPVLVFDGATPIIKLREVAQRRQRREQFAPNAAGTVQRLAKRLLIQEIKKSKRQKTENGGAFAAGFNLPEEEQQEQAGLKTDVTDADGDVIFEKVETRLAETSEEIARTLQEQEWQQQGDSDNPSEGRARMETSEEIARALQEEEWQEQQKDDDQEHVRNDWDTPIPHEDDDESSEHQKKKKKHYHDNFRGKEGGALDIEHLSSLPSHARKDIIEEARRRQRMLSRKEFMPVAGHPAEYSQVQVRNFLRSTRLNQSIVKMGRHFAQKNAIEGEQIASDPTRRVIFEKFDEKMKKRPIRRLIRRRDNDEESDSELEWDDVEEGKFDEEKKSPFSAKRTSRKETVILDSSEDEDAKDKNAYQSKSRAVDEDWDCDYDGDKAGITKDKSNVLISIPSSDDSSEGGFLKDIPEKSNVQLGQEGDMEGNSSDDSSPVSKECNQVRNVQLDPKQESHGKFFPVSLLNTNAPAALDKESEADDDDDSVDWEDGEAAGKTDTVGSVQNSDDDVDWEAGDGEGHLERRQKSEIRDNNFDRYDGRVVDTNNLAALQQAQSTAANLTDWAGRAFRRAIAQHEQEHLTKKSSPEIWTTQSIASPLSLKTMDTERLELEINDECNDEDRKPQAVGGHVIQVDGKETDGKEVIEKDNAVSYKKSGAVGDKVIEIVDGQEHVSEVNQIVVDEKATPDTGHSNWASLPTEEVGRSSTNESRNAARGHGNVEETTVPTDSPTATEKLLAQEEQLDEASRRQDRDMETINDEMKSEIISLIQLFGIPYVESPAEAEAQCVALEKLGLVDGIVTEDSDVFVFGGKTIYRNMFDDQKFVEVYQAEDAMKEMSLGKEQMVAMAMLLGGDYTEGVRGVGIVNAMEILQAFPVSSGVKEGLQEFRKWLDGFDPSDARGSSCVEAEGLSGLQKFHAGHRSARLRWVCPKHFPANNVLNAYINPVVDKSSDPFSWGIPDVDKLVKFCTRNMGWEASETKRMLDPIMRRLECGMRQTRLDTFMSYSDNIQFANVRSKRLRSVFRDVQKDPSDETSNQ